MDTLNFDFDLGDDIALLRDSVAGFAASRIAPQAAEIDRNNRFPRALWPELGALGLLGLTWRRKTVAQAWAISRMSAMEEISRASGSLGLSYGAHSNLCVNQIRRWVAPRRSASICQNSSPESTWARSPERGGVGFRRGQHADTRREERQSLRAERAKMWITNGRSRYRRRVCLHGSSRRPGGDTAFIVEKGMLGFTAGQNGQAWHERSDTGELVFQDCEVPLDNVLHEPGKGVKVLMSGRIRNA